MTSKFLYPTVAFHNFYYLCFRKRLSLGFQADQLTTITQFLGLVTSYGYFYEDMNEYNEICLILYIGSGFKSEMIIRGFTQNIWIIGVMNCK